MPTSVVVAPYGQQQQQKTAGSVKWHPAHVDVQGVSWSLANLYNLLHATPVVILAKAATLLGMMLIFQHLLLLIAG